MPAYKYQTKDGKTKWYANFYYTDWLGEKKHKCKRGFDTKDLQKSMNGCSWISILKAQQSSFPLWPEIIWKIWNPD